MKNYKIRNATIEDVEFFHNLQEENPSHGHEHILKNSIRAWVIEEDGQRVCIAGIIYGKNYFEAFSDIAPNLDAPKITIWRYAKIIAGYIKNTKLPVVAFSKDNPDSGKFLESLGFYYFGKVSNRNIYRM